MKNGPTRAMLGYSYGILPLVVPGGEGNMVKDVCSICNKKLGRLSVRHCKVRAAAAGVRTAGRIWGRGWQHGHTCRQVCEKAVCEACADHRLILDDGDVSKVSEAC